MNSEYTRGERLFFHFIDICINVASSLVLGFAYLAVAFAMFATATALYAWYGFHDSTVCAQFLHLGVMLLYYLAAPLLALTTLVIFCQQGWRSLWRARSAFEEKRLHPAFVFLLGVACCMLTYTANASVEGHWSKLPTQVAELLQVDPVRVNSAAPTHPHGAHSAEPRLEVQAGAPQVESARTRD